MAEKKYPYLGRKVYKDKTFVVFFTEKDHGVIVMSDIEESENPNLVFGRADDFDETMFEYLDENVFVKLSN